MNKANVADSDYISTRRRAWLDVTLFAAVGAAALSALLSVNAFPMISDDSVVYIDHSLDLAKGGFVVDGFRQVGYPLAIAIVRSASNLVGAEPLLSMAVAQRLLLVGAGLLAFAYWRWWALPFIVFLITATTIGYTNFILTEGLGLPLACLLVFPLVSYLRLARDDSGGGGHGAVIVYGGLVVAISLTLFALRFTYAVFGVAPFALVVGSWRTPHRKLSIVLFSLFIAGVGLFASAVSLENEREFGSFSPSAQGGAVRWYYAWHQVFTVYPENRNDPDLVEFFQDGFVHGFSRHVSESGLSYEQQRSLYDEEIEAMFDAAELSLTATRIRSMLWALIGGQLHDVATAVDATAGSTRFTVDELINLNRYGRSRGAQEFADRYNNSELPGAVVTDPIGMALPLRDSQATARFLLPVAWIVLAIGLFHRRTRALSVAGIGVLALTAVGLGMIMADNYRFLIASSAFAMGTATAVAVDLWGERLRRGSQRWPNAVSRQPS